MIDQVYTNQYFGFRYTIPDDMATPDLDAPLQNGADSTFVLLYVRDASERRLTMTADSAEYYSGVADAVRYVRKITQTMRARGFKVLRESADYTFAGQKFFRADYRKEGLYQSAIFTVRRGYALGVTAAAATPEQVDDLCESLTSLRFIGREQAAAASAALRGPTLPAVGYVMVRPVPQTSQEANGVSSAQPGPGWAQGSPTRVRVSQGVAEGMVVSKVPPEYPQLAQQARIQGQVRLSAVIGCDGKARELHLMLGHPMLVRAAMEAVGKWRYKPYQLNGQAVEVETTVVVDFTLE